MANPETAPLIDKGCTKRGGHVGRLHASIVAAMRVEVASDLVCPWCYIGKRRFDRAVDRLHEEGVTLDIDVAHRAFMLDPNAPLNQPTPVREAYAKKFGGRDEAERILANVTAVAAMEGIEFRMDIAVRANTAAAHRLLKLVERVEPSMQGNVHESIMRAYFSEGLDISRNETLTMCAERVGFPIAEDAALDDESLRVQVEEDLRWVSSHDITAVPTFVVNDSLVIPGAQDSDTFARLISRMAAR
jgi:predicted DsbA family dithiol-disulfide isomerase